MNVFQIVLRVNEIKQQFVREVYLELTTNKKSNISNYLHIFGNNGHQIAQIGGGGVVLLDDNDQWKTYKTKREILGLSKEGYALLTKVRHIVENRGGLKPAIEMLKSFQRGVKALGSDKSEYTHEEKYFYKDDGRLSGGTNQKRGHFRWDNNTIYTLSREEVLKITRFINRNEL